ncbi:hypothetical protein J7I93_09750 [Bacillus sp. ISL-47]|uniref:hypothetical protein n=1 Tax=Bacillus sp. ISL-47 TaxID=2819130 RepID=UPI001BE80DED|nr:hypothetical protein [Bacillus sp. ISL-47]MBT2688465.1 hypothetical protein [Bacillus sp. ISL-47]MBT2709072.1 hypothetical protein [Pseudomonas sp. ISL-84]
MYQKNCDKCGSPTFSSSEIGHWHCPCCGNDLTENDFLDAMTMEPIHVIYRKNKKPLKYSFKQINENYKKRVGLSYYTRKEFDYM